MSDTGPSVPAPGLPETKDLQTPSDHIAVGPPRTSEPSPAMYETKRQVSKPLIAAIVLLLLSLPVIIYFVSMRSQSIADIRNRATGGTAYPCTTDLNCANGYTCVSGQCQGNTNTSSCGRNTDSGAPVCCTRSCAPSDRVCEPPNRLECKTGGFWCTIDANGCTDQPTQPPDTATPTTGTNPVCQNIKVYKDGTQVADLAALKPGDDVVLAVKGNLSPTKAHFRVNGKKPSNANQAGWDETTDKNSSDEFTLSYTIPEGVSDFVIEGEVFINGAWH